MKKFTLRLFSLILLVSFIASPAIAQTPQEGDPKLSPTSLDKPTRPTPQLVSQEIQDLFKDGMSIEEFLINNKGPIPNALLDYADTPVTVIVQLEGPSLISYMSQKNILGSGQSEFKQIDYASSLKAFQDKVIDKFKTASKGNITVMGRYTKVLNGFMAQVAAKDINTIRALDGVKSVTRAPKHEINLTASVPLIKADAVWTLGDTGYTGKDITIAVIDTGIDYTHAMFGTLGDPNDYATNDQDIVEPGSFPTPKVIGGWDFAGTAYDAETNPIPVPDPDPLDENGHGTHVASTAAGVDAGFGKGVAPDALLYALKVFGASGSTNLVVDAIEWAMDPNGDDNIDDHVDVINMSLGSSFGPAIADDPEYMAVQAASAAGVFVVASAGNAGDSNYVTGSPGNTDAALAVAASTTGFQTSPVISYFVAEVENLIPYTTSYNPFTTKITAEMVDVDTLDGDGTGLLCDTTGAGDMTGKIALISRGACSFYIKINNAEALGAVAAIIYNNQPGIISMDTTGSTLPAGSILQSDGLLLKGLTPLVVSVGPDSEVQTFPSDTPVDTIADFSSRGPRGYDSMLKPEITAPGVAIFAANMGSGTSGVSFSGTSMAAPHVAGVGALMKEAHPDWTSEEIKAALMNTAVDLADPISAQVPRQGAGRVDALAAATTNVIAVGDDDFVSLSWGLIEIGPENTFTDSKTVTIYNKGIPAVDLDLSTLFTSVSDGATLTPSVSSVKIPPFNSVQVEFTLSLDATQLPIGFGDMEEYYGYVNITGDANLRIPFYFVPRPYTVLTELNAETSIGHGGLAYVDVEQTGPVASSLWAYPTYLVSDNDPLIDDLGDLRYVGMDYGGLSPYGDIIVPAFAMWGDAHSNQPYWGEVDMYIDADQDGAPDVVDFNYNYGAATGGDPDNSWVVMQVDFSDGNLYLASPYTIYADFNSGFQEWYLPAAYHYVTGAFDFMVSSFDWNLNEDFAGMASFDITQPPLMWGVFDYDTWSQELLDPFNEKASLLAMVDDPEGYVNYTPLGIMLVDYHGQPGVGQVYYWPLDAEVINVSLSPSTQDGNGEPEEIVQYTITLTNMGNVNDIYSISYADNTWTTTLSTETVAVNAGESDDITVSVTIPAGVQPDDMDTVNITATSTLDGSVLASVVINTYADFLYGIFLPLVVK